MRRPPVAQPKDLHLDMARRSHVALQISRAIAESARSHGLQPLHGAAQLRGRRNQFHADATTAGHGLHEKRKPDARAGLLQPVQDAGGYARAGGQHGNAGGLGRFPRPGLVAHHGDLSGRRTDEDQPGRLRRLCESGVLGEEAVAGMDGIRARLTRDLQNRFNPKVAGGGL